MYRAACSGVSSSGRATVDSLGVELVAESQHQPGPVGHLDGQPYVCGGLPNRLRQRGRIHVDLWWLVVLAGTVEADQPWKWTTPRRWNSATFTNETRHRRANSAAVRSAVRARVRRRAMVKRRHSSGACQLNASVPG